MREIIKYLCFLILIYGCQNTKNVVGKYNYVNKSDINIAFLELKQDSSYLFTQRQGLLFLKDYGKWLYNNNRLTFFSNNKNEERLSSFSIDSLPKNIIKIKIKNHKGEPVLGAQCNIFRNEKEAIIIKDFYSDFNGDCYVKKDKDTSFFNVSVPWQTSKKYQFIKNKNYFELELSAPTSKIFPKQLMFKNAKLENTYDDEIKVIYKKSK